MKEIKIWVKDLGEVTLLAEKRGIYKISYKERVQEKCIIWGKDGFFNKEDMDNLDYWMMRKKYEVMNFNLYKNKPKLEEDLIKHNIIILSNTEYKVKKKVMHRILGYDLMEEQIVPLVDTNGKVNSMYSGDDDFRKLKPLDNVLVNIKRERKSCQYDDRVVSKFEYLGECDINKLSEKLKTLANITLIKSISDYIKVKDTQGSGYYIYDLVDMPEGRVIEYMGINGLKQQIKVNNIYFDLDERLSKKMNLLNKKIKGKIIIRTLRFKQKVKQIKIMDFVDLTILDEKNIDEQIVSKKDSLSTEHSYEEVDIDVDIMKYSLNAISIEQLLEEDNNISKTNDYEDNNIDLDEYLDSSVYEMDDEYLENLADNYDEYENGINVEDDYTNEDRQIYLDELSGLLPSEEEVFDYNDDDVTIDSYFIRNRYNKYFANNYEKLSGFTDEELPFC